LLSFAASAPADVAPPFSSAVLVLDEPTNFLDREALGGLSVAIRDWGGAVCIISHNMEFVNALCPEIWHVEAGRLTAKGKVALVEDAFADKSGATTAGTSAAVSRLASRNASRTGSATTTPAGSGDEGDTASPSGGIKKKPKKLSRNQIKEQQARRAKRKLDWLSYGGEREPDTDDE
jgi:elongation factor 3